MTLNDCLSDRWRRGFFRQEILDCDRETACGERIHAICAVADALLALVTETTTQRAITLAVLDDVNVLFFG